MSEVGAKYMARRYSFPWSGKCHAYFEGDRFCVCCGETGGAMLLSSATNRCCKCIGSKKEDPRLKEEWDAKAERSIELYCESQDIDRRATEALLLRLFGPPEVEMTVIRTSEDARSMMESLTEEQVDAALSRGIRWSDLYAYFYASPSQIGENPFDKSLGSYVRPSCIVVKKPPKHEMGWCTKKP